MPETGENTNLHEIFPGGFEVMGQWRDSDTSNVKSWVRFFCADSQGKQAGRDACSRVFDSSELFAFMCSRGLRTAMAIEPQEELTDEDREHVAEILRARNPPKTFAARLGAYLQMMRRKAGGLDRRVINL